jgi:hypothetical protein
MDFSLVLVLVYTSHRGGVAGYIHSIAQIKLGCIKKKQKF